MSSIWKVFLVESTLNEINTESNESFCTVSGGDIFKEPQLSASNEDIFFGQHLSKLRRKNIGHLILTHININSFSYKFDQLVYGVRGKVDVLMVTEIKLDDSFPTMQFNIKYITLLN